MQKQSARARVYQRLYQACVPYHYTGPLWPIGRLDEDVRTAPQELQRLLEDLEARFLGRELADAGVADMSPDGSPVPSAKLLPGSPLVFLRRPNTHQAINVLGQRGCLSGALPVVTATRDHATQCALRNWHRTLFVAFNLVDALVLRGLGFPATTAAGLDRLTPADLLRLSCRLGWRPESNEEEGCANAAVIPKLNAIMSKEDDLSDVPCRSKPTPSAQVAKRIRQQVLADLQDKAPTKPIQPRVLFVACSLATLEQQTPAAAATIISGLRRIRDVFDIRKMDIGLWQPNQDQLEQIREELELSRQHFDPLDFLDTVEDQCIDPLSANSGTTATAPPEDFATALTQLRQLLRADPHHPANQERACQAFIEYAARVESELICPLYIASASPRTRNMQVTLMQLFRQIHLLAPTVEEAIARLGGDGLLQGGHLSARTD